MNDFKVDDYNIYLGFRKSMQEGYHNHTSYDHVVRRPHSKTIYVSLYFGYGLDGSSNLYAPLMYQGFNIEFIDQKFK